MNKTASKTIRENYRFTSDELDRFISTCPFRYKIYKISKRNSQEKRTIAHPSRVLKAVQRTLLSLILDDLLFVHDCAKAYKKGTGIKDNASIHLQNNFLLKMDFKKFFPSIKSHDFATLLREKHDITDEYELNIFKRVFFMKSGEDLVLSIGSPGSPLISNSMLFDFDEKMDEASKASGVTYSRYSDDLTFSTNTPEVLTEWPKKIEKISSSLDYPRLTINTDKTVHTSKRHNRHITGVTLSSQGKLSIGREKKRILRTKIHQASKLSQRELSQLRGHLAFLAHIEPDTYKSLSEKYETEFRIIGSAINGT